MFPSDPHSSLVNFLSLEEEQDKKDQKKGREDKKQVRSQELESCPQLLSFT